MNIVKSEYHGTHKYHMIELMQAFQHVQSVKTWRAKFEASTAWSEQASIVKENMTFKYTYA